MHTLNKELGYELEEDFRRIGNKLRDGIHMTGSCNDCPEWKVVVLWWAINKFIVCSKKFQEFFDG